VFRELGLGHNATSVAMVREILSLLPAGHPVRGYLKLEDNLHADAGCWSILFCMAASAVTRRMVASI
jgi:hypothetical protein